MGQMKKDRGPDVTRGPQVAHPFFTQTKLRLLGAK
jgi:hypothetical protein